MTVIDQVLLKAYLETQFIFFPDNKKEFLRVGRKSFFLDKRLKKLKTKSALYITAWNPFSEVLTAEQNQKRQKSLIKFLDKNQYETIHGIGRSKDCLYHEDSVLVLGCSREDALKLGIKYKQNAVVFYEINNKAELLLLR